MPIGGGGGGGGAAFNGGTITNPLYVIIGGTSQLSVDGATGFQAKDEDGAASLILGGGTVLLGDGHAHNIVMDGTGLTLPGPVAFYGGTPTTQKTLTSATATPEQIALALEASTLMGGT